MPQDEMTVKERWLAAVRMQPVDRLPFWPKLSGTYNISQTGRFRDMSSAELHRWIGSDMPGWCGTPDVVRHDKCRFEQERDGIVRHKRWITPGGTLTGRDQYDEVSSGWHPMEFPVKTAEDIERMRTFYQDIAIEYDEEQDQAAREQYAEAGQDAVMTTGIGESPLMHWVEWLAGIENAHFLLADHQDRVEALFDAMHRVLLRQTEICAEHSVADIHYLIENTSTSLISPHQYRRYCLRHIRDYAEAMQARDQNLVLHMCGMLKDLLPDLATLPVRGFEAFTSPPVANTRLVDGREACPDKCLIGGTNAELWIHDAGRIIAEIERDLDALPHHRGIVVSSAGQMPPPCAPETIKAVCEWVKAYPARMEAGAVTA
jgi:uroporphyrinogen-III decarboxylase